MSIIDALTTRNAHPRVQSPGPSASELDKILSAGLRAPDHGHLRPWRFVTVTNDARQRLGDLFAETLLLSNPETPQAQVDKARAAPLRAPLIIAGLLKYQDHPKIPRVEQVAAVSAALYGMSLAADALGYGCVWRTGTYAREPLVISALGGAPADEVIGFLYIGTRAGDAKPLPEVSSTEYVSQF